MSNEEGARSKRTTVLVVYGLVFTGLALILISIIGTDHHWAVWLTAFLRDTGLLLAAVMGGTILHEKLLRDETEKQIISEVRVMLEDKVPKLDEIALRTCDIVHDRFCKEPPEMTGLRLLTKVRRNSPAYYSWTIAKEAQSLFFAGRSILHRIDADVRSNSGGTAEGVLFRRLLEGSKITILFLDPRADILGRLAAEEGEKEDTMLSNIAISLGICQRLAARLEKEHQQLPSGAHLTIRLYDHIPYFAYHKENNRVIVGFYFLTMEGSSSAAYEVVDENTKKVFEDHFLRIRADATKGTLVDFEGARGTHEFSSELFEDRRRFLEGKLGEKKVSELLHGVPNPSGANAQVESAAGSTGS